MGRASDHEKYHTTLHSEAQALLLACCFTVLPMTACTKLSSKGGIALQVGNHPKTTLWQQHNLLTLQPALNEH